jgi:GMP synthase-like glutamine amidotransferase
VAVVVVDYGTVHLALLKKLSGQPVKVVTPATLDPGKLAPGDVVVLSGSHTHAVHGSERYFAKELELIRLARCPIIGVCLGFELIAYQAGGILERLPYKEQGIVEVFPTPEGLNWFESYHVPVAEGHRWVLRDAPLGYVELASSTDGVEAIGNLTNRIVGFQFHPEFHGSITNGAALFRRVLDRITSGQVD